jgi:hypothetical protein
VNASISLHGLGGRSANAISAAVVDGVIKGIHEFVTFHFPVWEPEFNASVSPAGGHQESVIDAFKHPFLTITRLGEA